MGEVIYFTWCPSVSVKIACQGLGGRGEGGTRVTLMCACFFVVAVDWCRHFFCLLWQQFDKNTIWTARPGRSTAALLSVLVFVPCVKMDVLWYLVLAAVPPGKRLVDGVVSLRRAKESPPPPQVTECKNGRTLRVHGCKSYAPEGCTSLVATRVLL